MSGPTITPATNMQLILQAPLEMRPDPGLLDILAKLADAAALQTVNSHVWRGSVPMPTVQLQQTVIARAMAAGLDAAFVPAGLNLGDFKLLAMDMDSTLITIECIDEIADMYGLKPQVAAITEAAMQGALPFRDSLLQRVALLEGLDAHALQRVIDERLQLSAGAEALLAAVQQAGLKTLLVSGGFTFFTDYMQEKLGLDFARANRLEIVGGKLTGRVLGDIVDAQAKRQTVEDTCATLGITPAQAIVMGDGANDLQMMAIAGMSVAFHAKPIVQDQATIALNFVGLDGILALFDTVHPIR